MKNLDTTIIKIGQHLKHRFILIICLFIFIIGLFSILSIKGFIVAQNSLYKEYPEILLHDSVNGKIIKIKTDHGASLIELDNCKFHIKPTRNCLYTPSYLDDFLRQNDFLIKHANSDTLFIYRDSKEYYFVINKFINKLK